MESIEPMQLTMQLVQETGSLNQAMQYGFPMICALCQDARSLVMEPFEQRREVPPKPDWVKKMEKRFTSTISPEQVNSSPIKQRDDRHCGTRGSKKVTWVVPKYITLVDPNILGGNFNLHSKSVFAEVA